MATVDKRENEDDFSAELFLKIWRWASSSSSWVLNTRIDRPHGSGAVNAVSFSPTNNSTSGSLLMTAGSDGCVKTWRTRADSGIEGDIDGMSRRDICLVVVLNCFSHSLLDKSVKLFFPV